MKKIGLILLFVITTFTLNAQDDITFRAICKQQVVVGEQFQLSYELNCEGEKFEAPNFVNFEIIGGPNYSKSSSIQTINGSVTRTRVMTCSYYLRALKEGEFTIPAATITVNKKKIKSTTTTIKVVKSSDNGNGNTGTVDKGSENNVFLEATPNKRTAYLGEQITLTYKLYYNVPISNLSISKAPSYSGFWTKDVTDNNGVLQQSSIIKNGQEYHVATIQEIVLIPQKAGTLTIDPLDITCVAQIRQNRKQQSYDPFENFFGDIMGSSYTNIKKDLKSQPIDIEVKAMPMKDKPNSFKGAVGQFTFTSKIDKTSMKSNDAFTITYTVSGKGNIELLDIPRPVFPPDFEVYDPKITTNTKNNTYGISGTKTAEYVVIPRVSGDFTLEPMEFSYFDPAKGRYVSLLSDQYELKVERSANEGNTGIIYAGGQEVIKVVGSDILHIMTNGKLHTNSTLLFASPLYFIIILVMAVVFAAALILNRRINKFNQNQVLVRNKKATKIAQKRLKDAFNYLKIKDQNHFYEELSQALWGYISDKLNILRSQLSMDTVRETMNGKNVPEDIVNQFIDLLNNCEYARFAPGDPGKKMDDLYQKGIEVITKAEKNLN